MNTRVSLLAALAASGLLIFAACATDDSPTLEPAATEAVAPSDPAPVATSVIIEEDSSPGTDG